MSDNYSGNAPSANPITLVNKFQKDLYPFSAFTFDDANTDSTPELTLNSPWMMSGKFSKYDDRTDVTLTTSDVTLTSNDLKYTGIINISGALTGNRTLYIPAISRKYMVIIRCTGGYNITISNGVSGGLSAVFPSLSSSETSWQSWYITHIFCGPVNVIDAAAWSIVGSSSSTGAVYIKYGDGTLECYRSSSVSRTITNAIGYAYYGNVISETLPITLIDAAYELRTTASLSGHIVWTVDDLGTRTTTGFQFYPIASDSVSTSSTIPYTWIIVGRWK